MRQFISARCIGIAALVPKLPVVDPERKGNMRLSDTAVLVFVLSHSGCVGRLRSGRIERDGPAGINVYNERAGTKNDYISGGNLRSWCVVGSDGRPLHG